VSSAGESADEYALATSGLLAFGALVEINISSPNTKLVYEWSSRPAALGALFRAVRAATAKPIIVKVSPDFRDANEEQIIPAALDAGITS
jgi:dihydroorotate dehydrogenase